MTSPQLKSKTNYEIKDFLGSGAFGGVMKICIHEDKKEYALKQISFQALPDNERDAALAEARNEYLLLRKNIPNVLKSFGSHYDQTDFVFKFSTECMDMNLLQFIQKKGSLSFTEFVPIFQDIILGKKIFYVFFSFIFFFLKVFGDYLKRDRRFIGT